MNLYIIGNGFDLYHGLPTSYGDFMRYLKKRHRKVYFSLLECVKNYSVEYQGLEEGEGEWLWSDLEKLMGSFNPYLPLEKPYTQTLQEAKEQELGQDIKRLLKLGGHLGKYLGEWICEVSSEIHKVKAKESIKRLFLREGCFLSFNYTLTLEEIYGIRQVLHLHGYQGKKLIIGHRANYNFESGKGACSHRKLNDRLLRRYYIKTYKDVEHILKRNAGFFSKKNLCNIDHIYILGHSLNTLDLIYIQKINSFVPNHTRWMIAKRTEARQRKLEAVLMGIGVDKEQISYILWDEL